MGKKIKNKNKKQKNNELRVIGFFASKPEKIFGTTIGRYIDGIGGSSITIETEIPFEELKKINDFLQKYDLYVNVNNKLRNTKEFRITENNE